MGLPGLPFPVGETGVPGGNDPHAGHDVASLSSARREGGPVGRRVCLDCDQVIGPLALCGEPTKRGYPCRVPVRTDLGFGRCWSHGGDQDRRDGEPLRTVTEQ
jgi:hypothetical protein